MPRPLQILPLPCLLFLAGCAEEWGPTQKDVVDVQGRVRLGARPVGSGWVEFIPIDGARGDVRSARLAPHGSFRATKVARGRNAMRIVDPNPALGVDRLFQQFYTPVRPLVESGKPLEIDLLREALKARETAPKR